MSVTFLSYKGLLAVGKYYLEMDALRARRIMKRCSELGNTYSDEEISTMIESGDVRFPRPIGPISYAAYRKFKDL